MHALCQAFVAEKNQDWHYMQQWSIDSSVPTVPFKWLLPSCLLLLSSGSQSPTPVPGDIWPGDILVVRTWVGATGISEVSGRDAANHQKRHRTAPPCIKNYLASGQGCQSWETDIQQLLCFPWSVLLLPCPSFCHVLPFLPVTRISKNKWAILKHLRCRGSWSSLPSHLCKWI